MYSISQIVRIVHPIKKYLCAPDTQVSELVYDTRKIVDSSTSIFFALMGERDGHDFIEQAFEKGVRNFIVSQELPFLVRQQDVNVLWVEDVWEALHRLAGFHRQRFDYPVIAITGSNGKTVVKEWLYEMLSEDKKVYQSPKSYNSQLGVALSLWHLSDQYELAIIEAGISIPGEMAKLERMISPTVGVLTSIGVAHAEGFASKHEKTREKLLLFRRCKAIIYPSKYLLFADTGINNKFAFSWGEQEADTLRVLQVDRLGFSSALTLEYEQVSFKIEVPFVDHASVENCLTCITVLLYLGYRTHDIQRKIKALRSIEMRLQLKTGINNCSLIDDTYSNDIGSLRIALDFLIQQQQHVKKTLILSRMSGLSGREEFDGKLISILAGENLSRLIWVGESPDGMETLPFEVLAFKNTDDLLQGLGAIDFRDETILVKGSRKYQFELVVDQLVAKSHGTTLEINLNAIQYNLKAYRSRLPKEVKLMAMVKAFSYGSGGFEIANLLSYSNVDYLTVAFADEGVELRQGGVELPIMVLSPDESTFDTLIKYNLEPEIYSFRILHSFLHFLRQREISNYAVHIKLDTGMHRLGFLPDEIERLLEILLDQKQFYVKSVLSHLVASGNEAHDEFTRQQIESFVQIADKLEQALGYRFIRHLANTSAITRWPKAHFDMVRLGIGLYGIATEGNAPILNKVHLFKTTITQLKDLQAGETIGYDRAGTLMRDSRIATVKVGYADGYDRKFGNGIGEMEVRGQIVPTVGKICMDMCMLDVTGIDVEEGEEVIIYPDIKKAAEAIGTIPYELLVSISSRVKRIYYYE